MTQPSEQDASAPGKMYLFMKRPLNNILNGPHYSVVGGTLTRQDLHIAMLDEYLQPGKRKHRRLLRDHRLLVKIASIAECRHAVKLS